MGAFRSDRRSETADPGPATRPPRAQQPPLFAALHARLEFEHIARPHAEGCAGGGRQRGLALRRELQEWHDSIVLQVFLTVNCSSKAAGSSAEPVSVLSAICAPTRASQQRPDFGAPGARAVRRRQVLPTRQPCNMEDSATGTSPSLGRARGARGSRAPREGRRHNPFLRHEQAASRRLWRRSGAISSSRSWWRRTSRRRRRVRCRRPRRRARPGGDGPSRRRGPPRCRPSS